MSVKEEYDFYMKEYKYNTNQCIQYVDSERKLSFGESETLLFVLTDNETASSAENLIAALRGRENVIFAGTNSRGCMLSGPGCRVRLPASGIFVSFGPMLQFFYDESVYTENRGFYPDIWVSGDALKKINSLISRYSITGVN
jgi:C-terminal processing protease CtpA/Prc